jgi:hypothetical protein
MHGLIFETSICYWQDQPGSFLSCSDFPSIKKKNQTNKSASFENETLIKECFQNSSKMIVKVNLQIFLFDHQINALKPD